MKILLLLILSLVACLKLDAEPNIAVERATIQVGIDKGDFRGNDNRVLQAAVDYVGRLGGGTVSIGPGTFEMRNSLILHDGVRVVGVPGKTILKSCDAFQSPMASSGGINEYAVHLSDPKGFRIGDGVMVQDEKSMYGFYVTQATITGKLEGNRLALSRPLYHDYDPSRKARVTSGFPVVGLWGVNQVELEGLTIDGNGDKMEYLTGCRGGGIYLFECEDVTIRNCTVRNYNGDGISFQTTKRVLIEDCVCEGNFGVGLHPGCGAFEAVVRRNKCVGNKGDGLFLCWRVQGGLFENNDFSNNKRHGISIGMKDSDNVFRNNAITSNEKNGIWFRNQPEHNGAHRNLFEKNRILDNDRCIVFEGQHIDLVFRKNTIGYSKPRKDATAFEAAKNQKGLQSEGNEFRNVKTP